MSTGCRNFLAVAVEQVALNLEVDEGPHDCILGRRGGALPGAFRGGAVTAADGDGDEVAVHG